MHPVDDCCHQGLDRGLQRSIGFASGRAAVVRFLVAVPFRDQSGQDLVPCGIEVRAGDIFFALAADAAERNGEALLRHTERDQFIEEKHRWSEVIDAAARRLDHEVNVAHCKEERAARMGRRVENEELAVLPAQDCNLCGIEGLHPNRREPSIVPELLPLHDGVLQRVEVGDADREPGVRNDRSKRPREGTLSSAALLRDECNDNRHAAIYPARARASKSKSLVPLVPFCGDNAGSAAAGWYTDNMDDAAGSSMLEQALSTPRHTLTVSEVAAQLAAAGVHRSERRIKYFCQTKLLDADKFPTPTGPQWYIDPASVPGLIGDLRQFDEQQRRRLQHAAAGSDRAEGAPSSNTVAAGASRLEHAAADQASPEENKTAEGVPQQAAAAPATAYVEQLQKRIDEKDETIKFLQEELVDRRSQISGMKAIIDGQRQLLETINNNVAPVFGALAQLVRGKSEASEDIKATIVDEMGSTDSQPQA